MTFAVDASFAAAVTAAGRNPYDRYVELAAEQRARLLERDLSKSAADALVVQQPGAAWFALCKNGGDSELLGVPVGRLDLYTSGAIDGADLDRSVELMRQALASSGLRYVFCRTSTADRGAKQLLALAGFRSTGTLVQLRTDAQAQAQALGEAYSDAGRSIGEPQGAAVLVRLATAADEPAIAKIAHDGYVNRMLTESVLAPDRVRELYGHKAVAESRAHREHSWVAEAADGQVVGFCLCRLSRTEAHVHGFIGLIVVANEGRGKKVGQQLMAHAMASLFQAGARWIELGFADDNAAARALYTRMGFLEMYRMNDVSWTGLG